MRISDWSSDVCSSDLSHITSFSQNLVLATTSPTVRRSFDRGGEQKSSPNSTSAASTVSVPPQRQKWPNLALKRGSIFATSPSSFSLACSVNPAPIITRSRGVKMIDLSGQHANGRSEERRGGKKWVS